ncbi:unnamed protein product [Vitrella brassicaformis CCMP3155]|uniref:Galactose oxidase n=2 Tax=Vitrella brassicaformis TaxID=1169539 RepID=A0A0G4EBS5_VITBC|nr:unnamed protein product [Vitrella brassicaformis CCMP3155]|eukprot:CEL93100.1 unnamed protein product [Vitrella brassicaformis CCMP3155]
MFFLFLLLGSLASSSCLEQQATAPRILRDEKKEVSHSHVDLCPVGAESSVDVSLNGVTEAIPLASLPFVPCSVTQGKWKTGPAMPSPHQAEHQGIALSDGKIYSVGGFKGSGHTIRRYDPAEGEWDDDEAVAKLPETRHHLMVTAFPDADKSAAEMPDSMLILGGYSGEWGDRQPETDVWKYSSKTNEIQSVAPMPSPRAAGAAVTHGGLVYVIGGVEETFGNDDNLELRRPSMMVYDPKTDTWEEREGPKKHREHVAAAVMDEVIYVAGGRWGGSIDETDSVEIYDPENGEWSAGPSMNYARAGFALINVNRDYLMAGGGEKNNRDTLKNIEFLPSSHLCAKRKAKAQQTLKKLNKMPSIDVDGDSPVAVSLSAMAEADCNQEEGEWIMGPDMPQQIHGAGIALMNNVVYLVGGARAAWSSKMGGDLQMYTLGMETDISDVNN